MPTLSSAFVFFLLAATPFSQAQIASGNIVGTVQDPQGASVSAVTVSARNGDTGLERTTVSDALGNYRFLMLAPGPYQLVWTVPGFGTHTVSNVQIQVGQSLELEIQLRPIVREEIVVESRRAPIDRSQTQQGLTIGQAQIRRLPINKRNYLDFSLLTPGVSKAAAHVDFTLPQAPTSGLSFFGQSPRSNSVTIDGVDNNDGASGAVRATLPQSAVREFQVNRSTYAAEFGHTAAGLVNIVSKSGTNRFSGSVFVFTRDEALDARNAFAFGPDGGEIDPPFSRVQAGFTLGGPIRANRSFFFISYEGLRQRESSFSTFLENKEIFGPTDSQQELIQAFLTSRDLELRQLGMYMHNALTTSEATYPDTLHLLEANSGIFPFENDDNKVFFRIDHQSDLRQRFLRGTFSDIRSMGDSPGGLNGYSHGTNSAIQDGSLVYGDSQFFSSTRVNDLRLQLARRASRSSPVDPYGPEITINGLALIGRNFFLPSVQHEKRIQIVDNLTIVEGLHELKMGAETSHVRFEATTEVFFGGRFVFGEGISLGSILDGIESDLITLGRTDLIPNLSESITSLQAYNFGTPLVYQQGFGNPTSRLSQTVISSFLQDRWRLAPELTATAGIRYEAELQPEPIPGDWNNLAPRLGFAYSPSPDTVVRGGYGIFYAPVYQAIAFIGTVLDGERISQVFVSSTSPGMDPDGETVGPEDVWQYLRRRDVIGSRTITAADLAGLGIELGRTPRVIFGTADDLVNPYSQHVSLGFERLWFSTLRTEVAYQMHRGVKLLRSRNRNLKVVGWNAHGPLFGRIDPSLLQDNRVESTGNSVYHGMTSMIEWRFSASGELRLAYTLSKAIDDTTDFLTDLQAANQLDLAAERALSAFDQRHRLVFTGMFVAPPRSWRVPVALKSWRVSSIVKIASGRPFNLLIGFDANRDLNPNTDRPRFAGRNTGRGPGFVSLDLRLSRAFRFFGEGRELEVIAEAFNLFNSVNYRRVNNVVGLAPLATFDVSGDARLGPTSPLGFTSAFEPRQIQLGFRFLF